MPALAKICGTKHGRYLLAGSNGKGKLPAGIHAKNDIRTLPAKGFFVILRLYGPTQPFFDKTWKPGDVERID